MSYILNIGLARKGNSNIGVGTVLREIVSHGFYIQEHAIHHSDTEITVVAKVTRQYGYTPWSSPSVGWPTSWARTASRSGTSSASTDAWSAPTRPPGRPQRFLRVIGDPTHAPAVLTADGPVNQLDQAA